jgi:uncharacterized protein YjbI with pentapeptide repeats
MTLPVTIPNTFANATTSIPLANLDANFVTIYDAVNGIGNGAESLSNVSITGGSVANVTLANVSISGETLDNVTLTNVSITSGNATFTTANVTTLDLTNIEVTNIKAKDGTAAIAIADSTGVTTQSTPAIISVNSSSDALRITQVGSGNALVVEDSANPDASPFVVDADGRVVVGATAQPYGSLTTLSVVNNVGAGNFSNNAFASGFRIFKSRSGTTGLQGSVNSGDALGEFRFYGSDGTNFIQAATITAAVDGTPGTDDMPGRLVFSTTADGASTPTERMRIDSAGRVGINSTSLTGYNLRIGSNITGATSAYGVFQTGQIQSDVTTNAVYFRTSAATAATAFTAASIRHFESTQGTIGAGSTVTNQTGFWADASLTGATNNYGFFSNIASGSGRWNFYANGTAANYMAGTLEVGSTIGVGDATPAASGAGITFPATQSASSDANTLDDYEEGTFTPTLQGGTTAGTTTYLVQEGTYTKVGRQVTVSLYIHASAATGTGAIFIGGLPFSSVSGFYGAATVMVNSYNWSSGTYLVAYMAGGISYFEIFSCTDDANWLSQSVVNEAQRFIITATYFV